MKICHILIKSFIFIFFFYEKLLSWQVCSLRDIALLLTALVININLFIHTCHFFQFQNFYVNLENYELDILR